MGDWYMAGFILFIGILIGMAITTAVIKNDQGGNGDGSAENDEEAE